MLSYKNEALPTVQVGDFRLKYADSRDIQLLMKRIRNKKILPDGFKYWAVSEFGGSKHRPHWHILFSTPKIPDEAYVSKLMREKQYHDAILSQWYTNKGSRRSPVYDPNLIYYNKYGRRNYDFHYIDPSLTDDGEGDCAFYVSKYMLKPDDYVKRLRGALYHNLPNSSFKYYWSIVRPKIQTSRFWGSPDSSVVFDYIQYCVQLSLQRRSKYFEFRNPVTGQFFPLSPYYRPLVSFDDHVRLRQLNGYDYHYPDEGIRISIDYDPVEIMEREKKFSTVIRKINDRDFHPDYLDKNFKQFDDGKVPTVIELPQITPDVWESDFNDCSHTSDDCDDLLF